jgi:Icc-related predicted phosphoesterase
MKIAVCSDLHLEFGPITFENTEEADTIVLSGDICVAADLNKVDYSYGTAPKRIMEHSKAFEDLLWSCHRNFKNTIMVMGNHEHYHGDFVQSAHKIREFTKQFRNVHFLDKESVTIEDTTFIGGTLWTDMNKEDPLTLQMVAGMMNDYRGVYNSSKETIFRDEEGNQKTRVGRFAPEDSVVDHKKMLDYIRVVTEGKFDQKFVVCGHHSPSKKSTHPRYADQTIINGAYSSDLSEFILDHPQIKLWTHGHTHEDFEYMIGDTRVVCNPRGYIGYEERANEFKLKTVEV